MPATMSGAFQQPPGAGGDDRGPGDPVSWLQVEQGWRIVAADGGELGTVAQVAGAPEADIFDGLALDRGGGDLRYVPAEQVGTITPGTVTLTLSAEQAASLGPYAEAAPETFVHATPPTLGDRIRSWLGR